MKESNLPFQLPQFLFGRVVTAESQADERDIIASSAGLGRTEARAWVELIALAPLDLEAHSLGIFAHPTQDEWLLARCHYHQADLSLPTLQLIPLPAELRRATRGGLLRLERLLRAPPRLSAAPLPSLAALTVPDTALKPNPRPRALAALPWLQDAEAAIPLLLRLLAAALSPAGLVVHNAPRELLPRLRLVAALQALLPRIAPQLSFSTNAPHAACATAAIRFYDGKKEGAGVQDFFPWPAAAASEMPNWDAEKPNGFGPYAAHLLRCWQEGGEPAALAALKEMDRLAAHRFGVGPLTVALDELAERHSLAWRIQRGEAVETQQIHTLLEDEIPPPAQHLPLYLRALLREELKNHDSEEAALIMRYMDANEALDRELNQQLEEKLAEEPDAVYRFLRQRVQDSPSARWRERLGRAAQAALRIAIAEGDAAIITVWLQLIAREPAEYELRPHLLQGIAAAQGQARADGQLATTLFSLALHFAHEALPALLGDKALLRALPAGLGNALLAATADDHSLDYASMPKGLLALALARLTESAMKHSPPAAAISTEGALWLLDCALSGSLAWLPAEYQTMQTLESWLQAKRPPLAEKTRRKLLRGLFAYGADAQFQQACANWGLPAPPQLAKLLLASGRPLEELLAIVKHLAQDARLSPNDERETYEALLTASEAEDVFPIIEQIAWWAETHPRLKLPLPLCWQLLSAAADAEDEAVARIALRRAVAELEEENEVSALVAALERAQGLLSWSENLRASLVQWWRQRISLIPLAMLSALDDALKKAAGLDEVRAATQTILALRVLLMKMDGPAFAAQLRRTLVSLVMLADAFEPLSQNGMQFDGEAAQMALRTHASGLSQEEERVLGKDCQELAHLLTQLAEHRTRGNVIRGAEELERRLMAGSQAPQGALDMLKWFAGYWGGLQDRSTKAPEETG